MIPIFIAGTGRSGTTVLRRILGCHPRIVSVPLELRIIVDPDGALDLLVALSGRWSPYTADKAVSRFQRLLALSDSGGFLKKGIAEILRRIGGTATPYASLAMGEWFGRSFYKMHVSQLIGEIVTHKSRGSWIGSEPYQAPAVIHEAGPFEIREIAEILAEFFHDLFRQRASGGVQTHWVEDTPENLLRYYELRRLFPNMRFIHIYRDPRDVVASYRRFHWGGDSVGAIAHRVAAMLNKWLAVRSQLSPAEYREVSLEELNADPEPNLRRLCEYIGLPMVPQLMQVPLDKTNAGRWMRELTSEEVQCMNSYLVPLVQAFGYDP